MHLDFGELWFLRLIGRAYRYVKSGGDAGLPLATYFCEMCERDQRHRLEIQGVLRELEVLLEAPGVALEEAVAQLKVAHALRAGTSVNAHLHEALDTRCAAAATGKKE